MCCIPQRLGQMDICKGVVSLATAAGAIYLLYKAIRAGIKCQPPLCSASPICVARECPRPGERARPQEVPTPQVSRVGGPQGDSSTFLSPSPFSPHLSQSHPRDASAGSPGSGWHSSASSGVIWQVSKFYIHSGIQEPLLGHLASAVLPKGKLGDLHSQSLH